ncbi:ATP-binding protein [Lentzea alba]|uniref:ATP-binding protein n=1 Tax=Lentzea alba TaxID=2714351 RepID=UPI0039BFAF68
MATDIARYGRFNDRSRQLHVRKAHYDIISEALDAANVPLSQCYQEDRGDGMVLLPKESVTARLIWPFVDLVNFHLRRYNQTAHPDVRLQLRLALHVGPAEWDGNGLTGPDVSHVFRLLEDQGLKDLLSSSDAALAFIASEEVHKSVIRHVVPTIDPDDFAPLDVSVKELQTRGWVRLRGRAMPGADGEPDAARNAASQSDLPQKAAQAGARSGSGGRNFQGVLDSDFLRLLRNRINQYDFLVRQCGHTVDVFRSLVQAYVDTGALISESNGDQVALAYLLAELSVVREDVGLRRRGDSSKAITQMLLADLAAVTADLRSVSDDDRRVLEQIIEESALGEGRVLAGLRGVADRPTASLYVLFWGIAQLALLADRPQMFRRDLQYYLNPHVRSDSVLGVEVDGETQRVFLQVSVTTRTDFEHLMEGWHVVGDYLTQVEDLWRLSGLISPPVRIFFQYPLWTDRSLRSALFTVDPRSITGLLMGKALYGARKHVWLRELAQNAIDATEMRRCLLHETGHEPRVVIELLDSRHLVVTDNGIGMTYQQILSYLTTLGRSGWRAADVGDQVSEASFLGRFGIGFASVFSAAKSVEVITRGWGTSESEGWRVRFSDLNRPFFVEPTTCDVGTQIALELVEDLSAAQFREYLQELFVYLPDFVEVLPKADIASSLQSCSVLGDRRIPASVGTQVQREDRIRIGTAEAGVKTELLVRRESGNPTEKDPLSRIPQTTLRVAVAGVLIFRQTGLLMRPDGKADETVPRPYEDKNLGLAGCHVTIDFDRETAPVLPSRDALDPDAFKASDVSNEIYRQVSLLLPELAAGAIGRSSNHKNSRAVLLEALESVVKRPPVSIWGNDDSRYHLSRAISDRAARIYEDSCPVKIVQSETKPAVRYVLLADLASSEDLVAVLHSVASRPAFSLYARIRGLTTWVEVKNSREMTLLQQAWPHASDLEVIDSTEKLLEDYLAVFPEVRPDSLAAVLRGDYAVSDSSLFAESLFFRVPLKAQRVSRREGVGTRRYQLASSQTPRVVLNMKHVLMDSMVSFLEHCSDAERRELTVLFDFFCDSVVDAKTKQVPEARWNVLREDLGRVLGVDLTAVAHGSLALSV